MASGSYIDETERSRSGDIFLIPYQIYSTAVQYQILLMYFF